MLILCGTKKLTRARSMAILAAAILGFCFAFFFITICFLVACAATCDSCRLRRKRSTARREGYMSSGGESYDLRSVDDEESYMLEEETFCARAVITCAGPVAMLLAMLVFTLGTFCLILKLYW